MTMLAEIQGYQEDSRTLLIACAKCKQWIANARMGDLDLPFRGSMFQRRVGCESWQMPDPDAIGMDLLCPHSVTGDAADLHLFIPEIPGEELECDELHLYQSVEVVKVEKRPEPEPEPVPLCPCGCGEEPIVDHKSGNRYAHVGCHLRWVYKKE